MEIFWFDDPPAMDNSERKMIEGWVHEHSEEIHAIHHFVAENEMEALKVVSGKQVKDARGRISIKAIELHFFSNLLLIVRSEERQDPISFASERSTTQLGCIEVPCGGASVESCQVAGHKRK